MFDTIDKIKLLFYNNKYKELNVCSKLSFLPNEQEVKNETDDTWL